MTSRSWCWVCLPRRSFPPERGITPVSASSEAESQLARPSFIVDAELGWPSDAIQGACPVVHPGSISAENSNDAPNNSETGKVRLKQAEEEGLAQDPITENPQDALLPEPPRRRKRSSHRSTTLIQCLPSNCAVTPPRIRKILGSGRVLILYLIFAVQ
jgi:hypothetical protein